MPNRRLRSAILRGQNVRNLEAWARQAQNTTKPTHTTRYHVDRGVEAAGRIPQPHRREQRSLQNIVRNLNDVESRTQNYEAKLEEVNMRIGNLNDQVKHLSSNCEEEKRVLSDRVDDLGTNYKHLATNYDELDMDYEDLAIKFVDLATDYDDISTNCENLATNYENLKADHVNENIVLNGKIDDTSASLQLVAESLAYSQREAKSRVQTGPGRWNATFSVKLFLVLQGLAVLYLLWNQVKA
ncbi:hypothetical protein B0T25DRAFT_546988 [Lasiosphaeria hispida]|uniref:t-SNARE coiled-coil homology domain-containing protein n=1 Tax=Lasiosphaeria hispida TaxID=260671 RepID=A0AAJ0MC10_9PEZI|nr:hypothetical protein B0T25DRAFT_546988 [Lasiosphaeria hispida]